MRWIGDGWRGVERARPGESPRRAARVARPAREARLALADRALACLGVLFAGLSVAFAGYMYEARDVASRLHGIEHLAIFAMPRTTRGRAPETEEPPPRVSRATGVDMTPTGSIGGETRNGDIPMEPARRESYAILSATPDHVWLAFNRGFAKFRVGDIAPGLGRVLTIESIGGKWRVVATGGVLSRTTDEGVAGEHAPVPPPGFSRSMIFDAR